MKRTMSMRHRTKDYGRTPPGVRELKQRRGDSFVRDHVVAPLPGCVN